MKKLLSFLSLLSIIASASPAMAFGYANLINCRTTYTRGGDLIYVGTYNYRGKRIELVFDSWCPSMVPMDSYR